MHRRRRFAAWIACFAILLNALAPSISHALQARRGQSVPLGEVCTSDRSGLALAALAAASADDQDGPAHAMASACPYCLTHAGTPAILPPAQVPSSLPALGQAPPPLFLAAPRPLFAWTAARPRGPPLHS